MQLTQKAVAVFLLAVSFVSTLCAQSADPGVYNDPPSRIRGVIERFNADVGILDRFYSAGTSARRSERFRALYQERLTTLAGFDFDGLNHDEQIDYVLFKNYLEHEIKEQLRADAQFAEMRHQLL